ncbi:MAG: hypothetical protein A2Y97_05810 [Nitrospirae bacterium RBG_13_39_12]|nr:MAG: hypothetical protein A2Y97_05810 [Nitrospirae bacterium RBG_13_39_12]
MKNLATIVRQGKGILCLLLLFSAAIAVVLSGCSKEKAGEPKGAAPVGTCDVSDKKPGDIKKPLEINYGNKVKLLGITVDKLSQNQLRVVYFWQPIEELGSYKHVFVHFTDTENKMLFQNDHAFCQKKSFGELKGKFVKESYMLNIPESAAGKVGYIKIGLWAPDLKTGPRLQIVSRGEIPTDEGNTRAIVEKLNL